MNTRIIKKIPSLVLKILTISSIMPTTTRSKMIYYTKKLKFIFFFFNMKLREIQLNRKFNFIWNFIEYSVSLSQIFFFKSLQLYYHYFREFKKWSKNWCLLMIFTLSTIPHIIFVQNFLIMKIFKTILKSEFLLNGIGEF